MFSISTTHNVEKFKTYIYNFLAGNYGIKLQTDKTSVVLNAGHYNALIINEVAVVIVEKDYDM